MDLTKCSNYKHSNRTGKGGKMSKIPIHDAYGRIVGYDQDSTAFGKLDLDMEDHGHLINEATEHIDKLNSEIARLEAELAEWRNSRDGWILSVETAEAMAVTANAELVAYKEVEDSLQKEIKRLDGELAEARKEKVCECDDYEKEMKHIDSFFVLGYVHGMKFTGKQFAYCPYCGGRIE